MKNLILFILSFFFCAMSIKAQDYSFFGNMSKEQLNLYLSRQINMQGLIYEYLEPCASNPTRTSPLVNFDKDLNMLVNINARIIGRAATVWGENNYFNDCPYWVYVGLLVDKVKSKYIAHGLVPPILEAGIYEIVSSDANRVMMSDAVSLAYGVPKRLFAFNNMVHPSYPSRCPGSTTNDHQTIYDSDPNLAVPDLSRLETQMYYYYQATKYIDAGYEALEFNQIENLVAFHDMGLAGFSDLVRKIRAYARNKNRGLVLISGTKAHHPGTDEFICDYTKDKIQIEEICSKPWTTPSYNGGKSKIPNKQHLFKPRYYHVTPGKMSFGWYTPKLPRMAMFDNVDNNKQGICNQSTRNYLPWGFDETTWYGKQPYSYRNQWLIYAYQKLKCSDVYLEIQGRRGMTVSWPNKVYRAATDYFGQENTIRDLWNGMYDNPQNWVHYNYTDEEVYNPPNPPHVKSSTAFVDLDRTYYIGNLGYIEAYIRDNTGTLRTTSPTWVADGSFGQSVTTMQVRAREGLIVSPDGKTIVYVGTDGYLHGFKVHNDWLYEYFDFPSTGGGVTVTKVWKDNVVFASNDRIYYISDEPRKILNALIRVGGSWLSSSPTHASSVPSSAIQEASGALTYDKIKNRLYYVGSDGFLYYHIIDNDWYYPYFVVPQGDLIAQNIRISPTKIAINGDFVYYTGLELPPNTLAYWIHALKDNGGGSWNTVSPSHSAAFYSSQPLSTQAPPKSLEIAVSPDGTKIAYIGQDNTVHYYRFLGGSTYSFATPYGVSNTASNSLQFYGNDLLFWNSSDVNATPNYDNKIHVVKYQTSHCENSMIPYIESGNREDGSTFGRFAQIIGDSNENQSDQISVFPNPANDFVTISIGDLSLEILEYRLMNVLGSQTLSGNTSKAEGFKIDTRILNSGTYVISLFSANGSKLSTKKLSIVR